MRPLVWVGGDGKRMTTSGLGVSTPAEEVPDESTCMGVLGVDWPVESDSKRSVETPKVVGLND